jgi:transposase
VAAPSLVPVRAGNRVKTNCRDAVTLARLHRAGELTAVWVPDPDHEAMRDLIRACTAAMEAVRRARQQRQGFLLRHTRVFTGRKTPADRVRARSAPFGTGSSPLAAIVSDVSAFGPRSA